VPVVLVGSKKKGSDRCVERTKRFSASKCPKHYGSSRSIGIKLALAFPVAHSRRWRQFASARAFSPKPALKRPPVARAGIALALLPPAPPVTDASCHTGANPAALSDRVGHLARLKTCFCCLQAATHRYQPPTTTLPSLHCLPSPSDQRPAPPNHVPPAYISRLNTFRKRSAKFGVRQPSTTPCIPSPPPHALVQAALPRRPRRLAPRRHRLARPSKTRLPAFAAASPPCRRRLARRRCRLAPPSPTAGNGHSVAFRGQFAGLFPPPAAAAKGRKTSPPRQAGAGGKKTEGRRAGGRDGRKGRGWVGDGAWRGTAGVRVVDHRCTGLDQTAQNHDRHQLSSSFCTQSDFE